MTNPAWQGGDAGRGRDATVHRGFTDATVAETERNVVRHLGDEDTAGMTTCSIGDSGSGGGAAAQPVPRMGFVDVSKPTPTANFEELQAFVAASDVAGRASIGTAAFTEWEWRRREEDIFGTFSAEHYRPKAHPDAVRVVHEKTGAEAWFPLFDEVRDSAGRLLGTKQLYPVLKARLDGLKAERIGGLMLMRDWIDGGEAAPALADGEG